MIIIYFSCSKEFYVPLFHCCTDEMAWGACCAHIICCIITTLMASFMGTLGGSILIVSNLVDIICLSGDIKG